MDILIFIISLTFGLILTIFGLRSSPIAVIAVLFNIVVFTTALVDGITEQIPIATEIVETTYNSYPAILLPAFFAILGVIKLAKYR